jgi:N-acetylglutamate synthase-like GNAT family acetyltransferase
MEIKRFQSSDEPLLLKLLELNTPDYFAPEEKDDFIQYIRHFSQNFFVLKNNNAIIGCGGINIKDDPHTAYLSWDIIHPDEHKKGLGSLLLNYRLKLIRLWPSIRKIKVRTSQITYGFYEKHGFRLCVQMKDYWAKGFDLYEMELQLS